MKKEDAIKLLQLEAHPLEGGFFRRTYESETHVELREGHRKLMTSIFYMLTTDGPVSHLHRNKSDIVHYFQDFFHLFSIHKAKLNFANTLDFLP